MLPQHLHQPCRQGLRVQDIIFHRAGIGQADAHLRILKLGPENAGRIQQQKAAVHRHPLLASRDAGAVFRLSALPAGNLVN